MSLVMNGPTISREDKDRQQLKKDEYRNTKIGE